VEKVNDKLLGVSGVLWLRDMWDHNHFLLDGSQLKINVGMRVYVNWHFLVDFIKYITVLAVD
jgi:hypothetical protein